MNENEMKQETTATENSMKQEEIVMNEQEVKEVIQEQENKVNDCDLFTISRMIEKLEKMIEKLEEKQEEINSEAEEILEDDTIFCDTCEELDNYNGFLCDERLYYMEDVNELYHGIKPLDLLEKVNDDFNTNDNYFWEDYEGLHSTDNREDFYREYHTNEEVWEEILNNTNCNFDSEIEEKIEQYEAITNMINCLQEKKKSLQEFVGDYEEMIEDYESLL